MATQSTEQQNLTEYESARVRSKPDRRVRPELGPHSSSDAAFGPFL